MPKQNHFKGANLAQAVAQATAVYRKPHADLEHKDACGDLALDLDDFKREAARALDRAAACAGSSKGRTKCRPFGR